LYTVISIYWCTKGQVGLDDGCYILKTWVFASCNSVERLLPPLLTRFRDMHLKPYTEEEFVNIAVEILDREEGQDKDIATVIADAVFNRLKSTNIRECIRIARSTRGDIDHSKLDKILDTFVKYSAVAD